MLTTLVLRWRMRGREQRGEDEGPSRPLASRLWVPGGDSCCCQARGAGYHLRPGRHALLSTSAAATASLLPSQKTPCEGPSRLIAASRCPVADSLAAVVGGGEDCDHAAARKALDAVPHALVSADDEVKLVGLQQWGCEGCGCWPQESVSWVFASCAAQTLLLLPRRPFAGVQAQPINTYKLPSHPAARSPGKTPPPAAR